MTRLLIVDDHAMMRQLLAEELDTVDGFTVAAHVGGGEEALGLIARIQPDLMVIDISLPGRSGIEVITELRTRGSALPVLCLTMHLDAATMTRAFAAGANGYAVKHEAFEDLVFAIRKVATGGRYVTPMLSETAGPADDDHEMLSRLTPRERQVVSLVADGLSTARIAARLAISERTVEFHRRSVTGKTGIRGVAEMTKFALRTGLGSGF